MLALLTRVAVPPYATSARIKRHQCCLLLKGTLFHILTETAGGRQGMAPPQGMRSASTNVWHK